MTLSHNVDTGWSESDGDPRWRSTWAALNRLTGADVYWLDGNRARPTYVAHLAKGTPVAVVRGYPAHKRWTVNIEGFEFWQYLRVMKREMWAGPYGFDTLGQAKSFANKVMKQAGANVRRQRPGSSPEGPRSARAWGAKRVEPVKAPKPAVPNHMEALLVIDGIWLWMITI